MMSVTVKIASLWDFTPFSPVDRYKCFRGTSCHFYHEDGSSRFLGNVGYYQTARCHITEGLSLKDKSFIRTFHQYIICVTCSPIGTVISNLIFRSVSAIGMKRNPLHFSSLRLDIACTDVCSHHLRQVFLDSFFLCHSILNFFYLYAWYFPLRSLLWLMSWTFSKSASVHSLLNSVTECIYRSKNPI
jgi:hypothetical protein